jgi:hypothetical protein
MTNEHRDVLEETAREYEAMARDEERSIREAQDRLDHYRARAAQLRKVAGR